jgi:hypothetical protein
MGLSFSRRSVADITHIGDTLEQTRRGFRKGDSCAMRICILGGALRILPSVLLGLLIGTAPALAVEKCGFIRAKAEREACYQRQEAELAAKRKPEPTADTTSLDSLRQLRQEDDAVYKSLRSICRGC